MKRWKGAKVLSSYGLACGYVQQFGKAQVKRLPGMSVYLVSGETGKESFRTINEAYKFAARQ